MGSAQIKPQKNKFIEIYINDLCLIDYPLEPTINMPEKITNYSTLLFLYLSYGWVPDKHNYCKNVVSPCFGEYEEIPITFSKSKCCITQFINHLPTESYVYNPRLYCNKLLFPTSIPINIRIELYNEVCTKRKCLIQEYNTLTSKYNNAIELSEEQLKSLQNELYDIHQKMRELCADMESNYTEYTNLINRKREINKTIQTNAENNKRSMKTKINNLKISIGNLFLVQKALEYYKTEPNSANDDEIQLLECKEN